MKDFNNGCTRVFLIMGDNCNMQCKYCKEHKIVTCNAPKKELHPKLIDWLKQQIAKEPTVINFYGGEPLLYFDTIKYIVETLAIEPGEVIYTTMCNGTTLTKEIVEFINKHDITVNLSWDGPHVLETRGRDVFAEPELRNNILDVNTLWVNSTITTKSYPWECAEALTPIVEEYTERHGYPFRINLGLATPTEINTYLYDYDFQRIYKEMQDIMWTVVDRDNPCTAARIIAERQLYILQKGVTDIKIKFYDIDISGNLFLCPFSRNTVATLDNIEDYAGICAKVKQHEQCLNCGLYYICHGCCKFITDPAQFENACTLRQAMYIPILELAQGHLARIRAEQNSSTIEATTAEDTVVADTSEETKE